MRAIIFHTTGKVKITDPKNVQQTQKNRWVDVNILLPTNAIF